MWNENKNRLQNGAVFLLLLAFHSVGSSFTKIGPCLLPRKVTCPDPEINFYLYTDDNKDEPQEVASSTDAILQSNYKPENKTKIIIHGYNSSIHLELQELKEAYLTKGNLNVWMVDWKSVAAKPCFPAAVYSLNHVGACVAEFIQNLQNVTPSQLLQESLHVIGFSLGAHAAAYTAYHLKPYELPRITGLDPALSFFAKTITRKLNQSDAQFVDVVHTDALAQGKVMRCGHIDFYMNGGLWQPGCPSRNVSESLRCNHHRAISYFAESVTSETGFWGWPCRSFFHYLIKRCPPQTPTVRMGEYCDQSAKGYYIVTTKDKEPFAIGKNFKHDE